LQATQTEVAPFLALHTADTVVVHFGGRRVLGRDDLPAGNGVSTGLTARGGHHDNGDPQHPLIRPDVAIISCTKHVADQRDTTDKLATNGSLTHVAVEDQGEWRVALA
jgi:hypothetical protein